MARRTKLAGRGSNEAAQLFERLEHMPAHLALYLAGYCGVPRLDWLLRAVEVKTMAPHAEWYPGAAAEAHGDTGRGGNPAGRLDGKH